MTPIYRPPVYGPAPTRDERAAAARMQGRNDGAVWLWRVPGVALGTLRLDIDDTQLPDCTYCALGPDGLPCALGTPPETERERLTREVEEARRQYFAELNAGHPCWREHSAFDLAVRALSYHIIKEQTP